MPRRYPRIDAWPQYWNTGITADEKFGTPSQEIIPVPRPIFTVGGGNDSAIIVEILQITWDYYFGDVNAGRGFKASICTRSRAQQTEVVAELNEPECFWRFQYICRNSTTDIVKGMMRKNTFDYTDDEGRGYLLAVDNIYIQIEGYDETDDNPELYIKLLYRFVRVPLREYIGIVQSQQT